jgi:hypothetical protein
MSKYAVKRLSKLVKLKLSQSMTYNAGHSNKLSPGKPINTLKTYSKPDASYNKKLCLAWNTNKSA